MEQQDTLAAPSMLHMVNISKAFPGVQALDRVDLDVRPAEILGLIGENGAGKSTLMKIISAAYPLDTGEIIVNGEPVQIHNPHHAQQLGISIIYQEFNLMPNLSVMENIFIGREPGGGLRRSSQGCWSRRRRCWTGWACTYRRRQPCAICRWPNSRWWKSPRPSRCRSRC